MAFKNDSDAELIAKSATVVQAFTPEFYAHLISLLPTPESVHMNHNSYAESYAAFLAGDAEKAKECEMHRNALNESLSIIVGLAKAVTIKDPKVPETIRLSSLQNKTTSTSTDLSAPAGFKVVFTPDGRPVASVIKVQSARGYQVWACDEDPSIEANWRLVASSPSCRGIALPGLNRSKTNWLRVRAVTGKGVEGPWSNIVSLNPN